MPSFSSEPSQRPGAIGSYRVAAILLGVGILAFFLPCLARGEILFPHLNNFEVGYAGPVEGNRAYSDASAFYVPELHHNISSGSYWNPHPELGRPAFHLYGMSRAFFVTQFLSLFTQDTLLLHFLSTLLPIALSASFGFLFLRANAVRPSACLAGSLYLAIGPFVIACQNFPLFLWGVCWALGLLLGLTKFVAKPSWAWGFGLALITHSIALTSYPQHIVWHGYLIVGWLAWLLIHRCPAERRWPTFAGIAGAGLVGLASSLPMYADLAVLSAGSHRGGTGYDFIVRALPEFSSWQDFRELFAVLTDPSIFGNVLSPEYTTPYAGSSLTPLGVFLVLGVFVHRSARRHWPMVTVLLAALLLAIVPGLYEFAVKYLGLGLSRTNPIRMLHVPAGILIAFSANRMLGQGTDRVVIGLALAWTTLFFLAVRAAPESPATANLVWTGLAFATALAFVVKPKPVTLLVAAGFTLGAPTACVQQRYRSDEIFLTSPLIEHLQKKTANGERFAIVQREYGQRNDVGTLRFLPSNQEALYGLASIHSYNPLSAREYKNWAEQDLGAFVGRRFVGIARPNALTDPDFRLTGVNVLATRGVIHEEFARKTQSFEQIQLYEPLAEPLLYGRASEYESNDKGLIVNPQRLHQKGIEEVVSEDHIDNDVRKFTLTVRRKQTLLFCSMQYHPHWRATGQLEDGSHIPLRTERLNDIYQGVLVPKGVESVTLRFEPWVRWMWLSKAMFVLFGVFAVVRRYTHQDARPKADAVLA